MIQLALPVPLAADERDDVEARPDDGADVDGRQARLLGELAANRLLGRLARLDPATRCRPERPVRELEADEQDPVVRVEHDGPRCGSDPELSHREPSRIRGIRPSGGTCERIAAATRTTAEGGNDARLHRSAASGSDGLPGGRVRRQEQRRRRHDDCRRHRDHRGRHDLDGGRHHRDDRHGYDRDGHDRDGHHVDRHHGHGHDRNRHDDDRRRSHRGLSEGGQPLRAVRQGAQRGRSKRRDRPREDGQGVRSVCAAGPGGDPGRLRDPGEGLRAVRRSDQGNRLQSRPGTRRGHDREAHQGGAVPERPGPRRRQMPISPCG